MSTPMGLVVTWYRSRGRYGQPHARLHRADCRTLTPETRTDPFADQSITRRCKVCKPTLPTDRPPLP